MNYKKLGNTGLEVSRICLGCMSYGDPDWRGWILDEEEARPHFRAALDDNRQPVGPSGQHGPEFGKGLGAVV